MKDLDWNNLGFSYIKTDYRFIAHWKDGKWDEGKLTTDNMLHIHEGSTAIHYGQQCFEGLKAYRCKDGSINLFRPDQNAKRMQHTADRLLMPQVPTELFIRACKEVVKANQEWLGPYGSGATLYLRPFLFGTGANIGVKTAPEFIFSVFCCPVGAYFKGGLAPSNFITTDYDRAAPMGTGGVKVGGNYAASLLPHELAAEASTNLQMRSISIQKHILKLKKWVQQTSLVSLKIINLSLLHPNPFYQVSPNTPYFTLQKSV